MKYPLDEQGIAEISNDILQNHRSQMKLVADLAELLRTAMECVDEDDAEENPWLDEANELLSNISKRKIDFETHRFNQKNGHGVSEKSPYKASPTETSLPIDVVDEGRLNAIENESGEMSEEEVAALFQTQVPEPKAKKKKLKPLNKMSMEEIEEWERQQDNSNDIYKVQARVKNAASRAVKANLTPQGIMVCNTFVHMLKLLYDFAATVDDKDTRIKLTNLVKSQEDMPASLISALNAGVRSE
jgi:hypothetical protein